MLVTLLLAASTALAGPVSLDATTPPLNLTASPAPLSLASYTAFSTSCEAITLYSSPAAPTKHLPDQLKARCRDNAGTLHNTSIDLNFCLGIDYTNASLLWSVYGKFSEYCSNCWSAGVRVEMTCVCALEGSSAGTQSASGQTANSTINLDAGIGNLNGTLRCAGGTGSRSD